MFFKLTITLALTIATSQILAKPFKFPSDGNDDATRPHSSYHHENQQQQQQQPVNGQSRQSSIDISSRPNADFNRVNENRVSHSLKLDGIQADDRVSQHNSNNGITPPPRGASSEDYDYGDASNADEESEDRRRHRRRRRKNPCIPSYRSAAADGGESNGRTFIDLNFFQSDPYYQRPQYPQQHYPQQHYPQQHYPQQHYPPPVQHVPVPVPVPIAQPILYPVYNAVGGYNCGGGGFGGGGGGGHHQGGGGGLGGGALSYPLGGGGGGGGTGPLGFFGSNGLFSPGNGGVITSKPIALTDSNYGGGVKPVVENIQYDSVQESSVSGGQPGIWKPTSDLVGGILNNVSGYFSTVFSRPQRTYRALSKEIESYFKPLYNIF